MPRRLTPVAAARPALALAVSALAGTASCASSSQGAEFPVTFTARADEPLAGVDIRLEGGKPLGTTGPDGTLHVTLTGPEGTRVPFRVKCPEGYRSPREMPVLTLRRFSGLAPEAHPRSIEVSVDCPPTERVAALVLKANRPNLPVLAQGREVARTNEDGVAHALVSLPPNTTFRVVIDTSQDSRLKPESPATTLTLPDSDEIFLIEQPFAVEERPRKKSRRRTIRRKKRVEKPDPPVNRVPEKLK